MNLLDNQRGSSHLVIFVAIAVIVLVGLIGFRVSSSRDVADNSSPSFSSSKQTTIKNTADVKKAQNELDSTTMDSPDQLDQDLNSL